MISRIIMVLTPPSWKDNQHCKENYKQSNCYRCYRYGQD